VDRDYVYPDALETMLKIRLTNEGGWLAILSSKKSLRNVLEEYSVTD
jgi:hypothetical protein